MRPLLFQGRRQRLGVLPAWRCYGRQVVDRQRHFFQVGDFLPATSSLRIPFIVVGDKKVCQSFGLRMMGQLLIFRPYPIHKTRQFTPQRPKQIVSRLYLAILLALV